MSHLTPAGQVAWAIAGHEAEKLGSKYIEPEHCLIGMCKVEEASVPSLLERFHFSVSQILDAQIEAQEFAKRMESTGTTSKKMRRLIRHRLTKSPEEREKCSGSGSYESNLLLA